MDKFDDHIVRSHIGGLGEGDCFADASELATAYGAAVFVPAVWPGGASSPCFLLSIPTSAPLPLPRYYCVSVDLADGGASPFLRGSTRCGSQAAGREGWRECRRLADRHGLVRSDGVTAQAVVECDGSHLHLVSFPSIDDVVTAALTLRRFPPAQS